MQKSNAENENLIKQTRKVWQPRFGHRLSDEEARQIAENVSQFFALLAKWWQTERTLYEFSDASSIESSANPLEPVARHPQHQSNFAPSIRRTWLFTRIPRRKGPSMAKDRVLKTEILKNLADRLAPPYNEKAIRQTAVALTPASEPKTNIDKFKLAEPRKQAGKAPRNIEKPAAESRSPRRNKPQEKLSLANNVTEESTLKEKVASYNKRSPKMTNTKPSAKPAPFLQEELLRCYENFLDTNRPATKDKELMHELRKAIRKLSDKEAHAFFEDYSKDLVYDDRPITRDEILENKSFPACREFAAQYLFELMLGWTATEIEDARWEREQAEKIR